ncbi:hypothetical protein TNCV_2241361 [Trichonephila clavipes]|nr:hypothetical protein TNCV_2241361 [Trichonephila clavipes]
MSVLYQPVYIAHANMFYHEGKPVPIELSIATIPRDSKDFRSNCPENACLRLVQITGPLWWSKEGSKKNFQELRLYTMALEILPKFKDICDGTFPNPMHEGVHEEEDISYCTMLKSYQFAKYMQQF